MKRLWVNADCGLKTCNGKEVIPYIKGVVVAAGNASTGKV